MKSFPRSRSLVFRLPTCLLILVLLCFVQNAVSSTLMSFSTGKKRSLSLSSSSSFNNKRTSEFKKAKYSYQVNSLVTTKDREKVQRPFIQVPQPLVDGIEIENLYNDIKEEDCGCFPAENVDQNSGLHQIFKSFDIFTNILQYLSHQDLVSYSKVFKFSHFLCSKYLNALPKYSTVKIIKINKPLLFQLIFQIEFSDIFARAFPQLLPERISWSDAVALLGLVFDHIKMTNKFEDYKEKEERLKFESEYKWISGQQYTLTPNWFTEKRALLEYISQSSETRNYVVDDYRYFLTIFPLLPTIHCFGKKNRPVDLLSTLLFNKCNEANLNCLLKNMKSIADEKVLKEIENYPQLNMNFFSHSSLLKSVHVCSPIKSDFKDLFFIEGFSNALLHQNRDLFIGILSAVPAEKFPRGFGPDLAVLKSIFVDKTFSIQHFRTENRFDNKFVFHAIFAFSEDRKLVDEIFQKLSVDYVTEVMNGNTSLYSSKDFYRSCHYDSQRYQFSFTAEFHQSVLEYILNHNILKFFWYQVELPQKGNHLRPPLTSYDNILNSKWIRAQDIFVRKCFFTSPLTPASEEKLAKMINLKDRRRVLKNHTPIPYIHPCIESTWWDETKDSPIFPASGVVYLNNLDFAVLTMNTPAISFIINNTPGGLKKRETEFSLQLLDLALKDILLEEEKNKAAAAGNGAEFALDHDTVEKSHLLQSTISLITENMNINDVDNDMKINDNGIINWDNVDFAFGTNNCDCVNVKEDQSTFSQYCIIN